MNSNTFNEKPQQLFDGCRNDESVTATTVDKVS